MTNPTGIFAAVAEASASHGLPVLVIGGHAVNAYGYTRTTIDADFLIAVDNLSAWRSILENWGYQSIYQTDAFAKFKLPDPAQEAFVVDLMTVESATFAKLHAASHKLSFGDVQLHVPAPLHLIALKLHALKNHERFKLGKDLTDILQLIRICQIETSSIEFQKVLNQYANESTRQALHLLLSAD